MIPKAIFVSLFGTFFAGAAYAEAPALQTPAPVIYLADNLDEADDLGWCIDTLGRGFAERLQAHSCKPQGGDVQFSFTRDSGLIRSVEFSEYCMRHDPDGETVFSLSTCSTDDPAQVFAYDAATGALSPADNPELCVSVGTDSRAAGPFMSRDLLLEPCANTDSILRSWVVLNGS